MIRYPELLRRGLIVPVAVLLAVACDGNPVDVEVVLPDSGWQALALGEAHACGILPDRRAACWGSNANGELGVPLEHTESCSSEYPGWVCSPRPLVVDGASSLVALAAGRAYSCGLTEAGRVLCWGDGSPEVREMATGGGRAIDLDAGLSRFCATLDDGTATCWEGSYGTSPLDDADPAQLAGPEPFRSTHAGNVHACALGESGTAYCWGGGNHGQLGIGGFVEYLEEPTPISGSLRFGSLSAGALHTCGVTLTGVGYCWGSNTYAQLGAETPETCMRDVNYPNFCPSPAPLRAAGGLRLTLVAAGIGHTCGIGSTGNALCWGENFRGQLGAESVAQRCGAAKGSPGGLPCSTSPILPDQSRRFGRIDVGWSFSCGISGTGEMLCWGTNSAGRLGTLAVPMSESTHVPQRVEFPQGF